MKALAAALRYAARGWPVFPCSPRKTPLTPHGFHDAATDPLRIRSWWTEWPPALIGMPTGLPTGIVVLDIDMKAGRNGRRSLADLTRCPILPAAPTVRTLNAGYHLHFLRPAEGLRNSASAIGPGLDWRGDGGYVILPSPGSGYRWDSLHYGNCRLGPAPTELLPRRAPLRVTVTRNPPPPPNTAALAGIVRAIATASEGERNSMAFWGACRLGEMVAQGFLDAATGRAVIVHAAARAGLLPAEALGTAISGINTGGQPSA